MVNRKISEENLNEWVKYLSHEMQKYIFGMANILSRPKWVDIH